MRYIKNGQRKGPSKRLLACGTLLIIIIALAVLELTGVTHIFHDKHNIAASGSSFSTKGEPKSGKASSDDGGASTKSANSPSANLIAPYGDFVSNHHPNLDGSPAPNTISSVCNSTPGATCKITFTKDGVTKTLPQHTIDANGSAYWNWKLQDLGLSTGSWKIQAVASLNSQTKTADDAMDLEVAQ